MEAEEGQHSPSQVVQGNRPKRKRWQIKKHSALHKSNKIIILLKLDEAMLDRLNIKGFY